MKTCSKCKIPKELKEFNKNKKTKDKLSSYCRECVRKVSKKYYYENQSRLLTNFRGKNDWVLSLKESGECKKCGFNTHLAALDFHHLEPSKKEFGVSSRAYSTKDRESIKNEIKKCIILCANCHRIFHYREKRENITIEYYLNE